MNMAHCRRMKDAKERLTQKTGPMSHKAAESTAVTKAADAVVRERH